MHINNEKIINSFTLCRNKGLTLVELMVVIAIFMIITSVAIFNYGNFNSTVSLQNLTDDIALSIRKAQSFAIGARDAGGSSNFDKSYGMHFSISSPDVNQPLSGSNKSFLMFSIPIKDTNNITIPNIDKKYKDNNSDINSICGHDNDCIELFNILSIDEIEEINAYDGSNPILGGSSDASIDIVFTRPDPKASLCYRSSKIADCQIASSVDILISNGQVDPDKRTKIISIQNTGQISTQQYEGN